LQRKVCQNLIPKIHKEIVPHKHKQQKENIQKIHKETHQHDHKNKTKTLPQIQLQKYEYFRVRWTIKITETSLNVQ